MTPEQRQELLNKLPVLIGRIRAANKAQEDAEQGLTDWLMQFYGLQTEETEAPEPEQAAEPAAAETEASGPTEAETAPEPEAPPAPTVTKEQVRAVLAEKAKDLGSTAIKELFAKYGATKLSGVKEEDYAALLADAEALG